MIVKIKRKIQEVEAIQFTGENDHEVNHFVSGAFERVGADTWINKKSYKVTIYKKDWVLKYNDGTTRIASDEGFNTDFDILPDNSSQVLKNMLKV